MVGPNLSRFAELWGTASEMTVFSDKLAGLPATISLVVERGVNDVASALRSGRGKAAIAVGSGGSIVAAQFFARCRTTLGLGPTVVMTPMQLVLAMDEWAGSEIWLFSARADNPDIAAAFTAACGSRAEVIRLMTIRSDGATALTAANTSNAQVHILPVADHKDGFLATHSMASMLSAVLLASDALVERPDSLSLSKALDDQARAALSKAGRGATSVEGFRPGDTLILLADPQVSPVAALIETALWETGIAPVQLTDFRNFAHGRHVWAAKHSATMFVLALTTCESAAIWSPIADALSSEVRSATIDFGNAGRLRNAVGVLEGLALVNALGRAAGIDPGRPGRGSFAEAIYEDSGLKKLALSLTPAVRQKASAQLLHDPLGAPGLSVCSAGRERLRSMSESRFAGVALDYDGTVVATDARLDPPGREVLDELVRLVEAGIQIGIATGRGGSAGEMLRDVLPERVHRLITMGYYNGAYVRSLDVDIRLDQPPQDPTMIEVADWIDQEGLLDCGKQVTRSRVQLTINHADLVDVAGFADQLERCPAVGNRRVRVLRSHHSFDVVSAGTSKLRVVEALADKAGRPGEAVLGIGDSGSALGNDHELLSGPNGLSVDSICGGLEGCWSIFGTRLTGPAALLRILSSLQPSEGRVSFDLGSLGVDAPA